MKTPEPRSLLTDFPLLIDINPDLIDVFVIWKKKFEEKTGRVPNDMDYMYAGYILSNPIVRDQYKEAEKVINHRS
jgi:hypothetical protein